MVSVCVKLGLRLLYTCSCGYWLCLCIQATQQEYAYLHQTRCTLPGQESAARHKESLACTLPFEYRGLWLRSKARLSLEDEEERRCF